MALDDPSATAFARRDKVLIYTMAPLLNGAHTDDWERFGSLHSLSETDEALGASVRTALLRYDRTPIPIREYPDGGYNLALARKMGLKSAGTLYSFCKYTSIRHSFGDVTFTPWRRRFRGFEPFPKDFRQGHEEITLPFDHTDARLGAALRDCLARCL